MPPDAGRGTNRLQNCHSVLKDPKRRLLDMDEQRGGVSMANWYGDFPSKPQVVVKARSVEDIVESLMCATCPEEMHLCSATRSDCCRLKVSVRKRSLVDIVVRKAP